jgi:hypothetical protein
MWKNSNAKAISTTGTSGGLCTLWDPYYFNINNIKETNNWMLLKKTYIPSGMSMWLLNIYMPCTPHEKLHCWYSLIDISEEVGGSNLIAVGDFNTILSNKEKIGCKIV